ncbi:hypothetical protein Leryth_019113 [Lithospermum erythrorhizon]|nr:hypothetical protein Leryth_019113 [Lithospermum erythrorhizon]
MEVSVVASCGYKEVGFCSLSKNLLNSKSTVFKASFGQTKQNYSKYSTIGFCLKASAAAQSEAVVSTSCKNFKPDDKLRLYVGLPLDTVSECNSVNHIRAIAAGLKALKLLGVDGVELPIWWGVVERQGMGKYDWTGYLAVAELVRKLDLKLHVSLCFHASKQPEISLPEWVAKIGESSPSIFFADRSGEQYKDCLSFAVDELPVLDGKTPVQVYRQFFESFKSVFSPFMGSTITGISIGLGPDGELRYPSHHQEAKRMGAGEFQCHDKHMLDLLKQHAEASGNPLWGLGGPHDAAAQNESPMTTTFFKEQGGSWESPYGDFFLSWYSGELISHGDRILSLASSTFGDSPIEVSGKLPLMHSWYKTRSHPAELTAGFYNTCNHDGYKEVARIFSRNSCKMILPGMDLSDEHQQSDSLSSPETLLQQITSACREQKVEISSQNSSITGVPKGFEIKNYLLGENVVDLFTYQRMGADFFSPDNFPSFTNFVRNLRQPEVLHSDDLPNEEAESTESLRSSNLHMQAA